MPLFPTTGKKWAAWPQKTVGHVHERQCPVTFYTTGGEYQHKVCKNIMLCLGIILKMFTFFVFIRFNGALLDLLVLKEEHLPARLLEVVERINTSGWLKSFPDYHNINHEWVTSIMNYLNPFRPQRSDPQVPLYLFKRFYVNYTKNNNVLHIDSPN